MNVTVVVGHLSHPPEHRTLPSGDHLVGYDVTVAGPDGKAESVPVVWPSAPTAAGELPAGAAVVVVGRVRRRFFRSGGSTQSRTEVVADVVVPARRAAAARRLLEEAASRVADASGALATEVRARPRRRAAQETEAS